MPWCCWRTTHRCSCQHTFNGVAVEDDQQLPPQIHFFEDSQEVETLLGLPHVLFSSLTWKLFPFNNHKGSSISINVPGEDEEKGVADVEVF